MSKWPKWCLQIASFVQPIIRNLKTANLLPWTTKKSSKFLHLGTNKCLTRLLAKWQTINWLLKEFPGGDLCCTLFPVRLSTSHTIHPTRCKSTQTCHISLSNHFEKHWMQKIVLFICLEHFSKHGAMCRNTSASFSHVFHTCTFQMLRSFTPSLSHFQLWPAPLLHYCFPIEWRSKAKMTYEASRWCSCDINAANWSLLWPACGWGVELFFRQQHLGFPLPWSCR